MNKRKILVVVGSLLSAPAAFEKQLNEAAQAKKEAPLKRGEVAKLTR